jgi:hypothetical protein
MTKEEVAEILAVVLKEHPQTRAWSPERLESDQSHVVAVETGDGTEFFIEVQDA